jgi:protein-disulfide isomerase
MRWFAFTAFLLALACAVTACDSCDKNIGADDGGAATTEASTAQADITLEGVDTSSLAPREKREWVSYVTEFLAPCPEVPVSIAQCVKEKRNCAGCAQAAKYIAKAVRMGWPREQIEVGYKAKYDPRGIAKIPVDDSPTKGPADAKVTLVEFADFECPACGAYYPLVEAILEEYKGQVRLIFKNMPLSIHERAEPAARAAYAAGQQGKFWEMHRLLFTNQKKLDQSDIDNYARTLGLDLSKFKTDSQSPAAHDRVAKDKKLGEELKLIRTPTFYINGRILDEGENLAERVATELGVSLDAGAHPTPDAAASAVDAAAPTDAAAVTDAKKDK